MGIPGKRRRDTLNRWWWVDNIEEDMRMVGLAEENTGDRLKL